MLRLDCTGHRGRAKIDQIRNSRLSKLKRFRTLENHSPLLSFLHAPCSMPHTLGALVEKGSFCPKKERYWPQIALIFDNFSNSVNHLTWPDHAPSVPFALRLNI